MERSTRSGIGLPDLANTLFALVTLAFFFYPRTYDLYQVAYGAVPVSLSFAKFAIFATWGEMIVSRLRTGSYLPPHFGLLPKAIVWGVLGILIWVAFGIFSRGVTATFFPAIDTPSTTTRILIALTISFWMNVIFAPVMMMIHHMTDTHIGMNNGRFPLRGGSITAVLSRIDWDRMWGFVYKKTIPCFWIPAHTITFLLPEEIRTLFAVALSVALGLLLTISGGTASGRTKAHS